jgi:hypothetical protein
MVPQARTWGVGSVVAAGVAGGGGVPEFFFAFAIVVSFLFRDLQCG